MEIDLETLIVSVDRPSRIRELEEGDSMDTGETDGSGEITVKADSVEPIGIKSFLFAGASIEVSGGRMEWTNKSIVEAAAEMLVRDYIEGLDTIEDAPMLVGHIAG